jgi:hypothetical protein
MWEQVPWLICYKDCEALMLSDPSFRAFHGLRVFQRPGVFRPEAGRRRRNLDGELRNVVDYPAFSQRRGVGKRFRRSAPTFSALSINEIRRCHVTVLPSSTLGFRLRLSVDRYNRRLGSDGMIVPYAPIQTILKVHGRVGRTARCDFARFCR